MNTGDDFEVTSGVNIYLSEVSPQDKPWDKHRSDTEQVRDLYRGSIFDKYADRIDACSRLLQFRFVERDDGALGLKLDHAFFCRVRHCIICQCRKQLKWRGRVFKALPLLLEHYPQARFIFLTLTVNNCRVEDLRTTLAWMNKSWVRLSQRKQFPALGWLKAVEVTRQYDCTTPEIHDSKRGKKKVPRPCPRCIPTDYAHPHFHAILMVNEGYFKRGYLSKDKWISLWRESLGVSYDPSIAVRVVKGEDNSLAEVGAGLSKGFCEVLKYSVKPSELISDREWLLEITAQLHKTRAVAVGGEFRKYISDEEPEDLIGKDDDSDFGSEGIMWFGWRERLQHYVNVDKTDSV